MKVDINKEWCIRMAQLEGDAEIGAGCMAFDPVFDNETVPVDTSGEERLSIAFRRLITLMRWRRGITIEKLADDADVDMTDLVQIESDPYHKPELRTTCHLADYFKVSQSSLMQVAGLAELKDLRLLEEGVHFVARTESKAGLMPDKYAALEEFVAVLS